MTTKWRSPIVAGKDPETGKFFVEQKVFAQKAKINFTDKDIDVNPDVGDKDGSGLRKNLNLH